jgi:hypothetical protein
MHNHHPNNESQANNAGQSPNDSESQKTLNREIERMLKALEKQNRILSKKLQNANGSSKKDKSSKK